MTLLGKNSSMKRAILLLVVATTSLASALTAKYDTSFPSERPYLIFSQERLRVMRQQYTADPTAYATLFEHTEFAKDYAGTVSLPELGLTCVANALAWHITGQDNYAQRASDVWMPYITNATTLTQCNATSVVYFAMCYDMLYNYYGLNESQRAVYKVDLLLWSTAYGSFIDAGMGSCKDANWYIYGAMNNYAIWRALGPILESSQILERADQMMFKGPDTDNGDTSVVALMGQVRRGFPVLGWYYGMDELHAYSMLWKMLEDFGAGEELPRRFPKFWSDVATAFLLSVAPNRRHYHSYNYDPEARHQVSKLKSPRNILSAAAYYAARENREAASYVNYFLHTAARDISDSNPVATSIFNVSSLTLVNFYSIPGELRRSNIPAIGEAPRSLPHIALYRSSWAPTGSMTWAGFHMHPVYRFAGQVNQIGSFFLWKGGQYLTRNAMLESPGSSACDSLNSLEIVDTSLEHGNPVLSGGTDPLKTFPEMRAFSDIAPTSQTNEFMYARLDLSSSFNVPSAYEPDNSTEPTVVSYQRHFLSFGMHYVLIFDRLKTRSPIPTVWRYRIPGDNVSVFLDQGVDRDTVRSLAPNGFYHLLTKVLFPPRTAYHPEVVSEEEEYQSNPNCHIHDLDMSQRAQFTTTFNSTDHVWAVIMTSALSVAPADDLEPAEFSVLAPSGASSVIFKQWHAIFFHNASSIPLPFEFWSNALYILVADLEQGCYKIERDGYIMGLNVTQSEGGLRIDRTAEFSKTTSNTIRISLEPTCIVPDTRPKPQPTSPSGTSADVIFVAIFAPVALALATASVLLAWRALKEY